MICRDRILQRYAFVDWFNGWPEVFAVPDKTADTPAYLLIEEIFLDSVVRYNL